MSASNTDVRLIVWVGTDQSIEWSARTITIEESHVPVLLSFATNRPTWVSVETRAARRAALSVVPVRSEWPIRSTSPRLQNTKSGSNWSTIAINASIVKTSGAWPVTGSTGFGSQRWVARSPKTE